MEQEDKVYILTYSGYQYNDEYYSPSYGGRICHLLYNRDEAIQVWKKLEIDFQHENRYNPLAFEECSGDINSLGLDFDTIYDNYHEHKLTDDEIFNVTVKLNRHIYELIEYPKDLKCYIAYFSDQNKYSFSDETTEWDNQSNLHLTFTHVTNSNACFISSKALCEKRPISLRGTFEELSDSPLLLERLIEQDKNLEYVIRTKCLNIIPNQNSINSLNALLKKPFFEIKCLSIEEIFKIEKQLNHDLGW